MANRRSDGTIPSKPKPSSVRLMPTLRMLLLLLFLLVVSPNPPGGALLSSPPGIVVVSAATTTASSTQQPMVSLSDDEVIDALVGWVLSKPNGYFNSAKIEWKPFTGGRDDDGGAPTTTTTSYGMFASHDVEKGETLMVIPRSALLTAVDSDDDTTRGGVSQYCDTYEMLVREQLKWTDSDFFPYLRFLFGDDGTGDGNGKSKEAGTTTTAMKTKTTKRTTKRTHLPAEYSPDGKLLLEKVVGRDLLPPRGGTALHRNTVKKCLGGRMPSRPVELDAFMMMVPRSWNEVMIPVYDMVNHRNGKWTNVDATSAHTPGQDVRVYATRDIAQGEQLYMSYNECSDIDCDDLKYEYVTQHILADYGFVEDYPRRWILQTGRYTDEEDYVLEVDVVEDDNEDIADETDGRPPQQRRRQKRAASWPLGSRPSSIDALNWIRAQLRRLRDLDVTIEEGVKALESDQERETILEYHRAYKEALELAWMYRGDDGSSSVDGATGGDDSGSIDAVYDPLTGPRGLAVEGSNTFVCLHNPTSRDYDASAATSSQYQGIAFTYNEETDNTCLQLSGWLQTCTNFRPHYHEAFVHVPAQYVKGDVKRVAFLGGGDNMILHEILKYPHLELVVGMELDQQVIRSSFQHLGTLPYFDDHRVQWWFGDATKSLLALPEEYFGSFDLVLVDLQTFVADALKVTDKLTIMDTAILLMKQDGGVIAKNEDFPVRTNVGFAKYTVDLEYHDLPHICQQSITMGSNSIDFVTATPKIHEGVDVMAIDLAGGDASSTSSNPFHAWYGYRQTVPNGCEALNQNATKSELANDGPSAAPVNDQIGVLVILEAEDVSLPLDDISSVQSVIRKAAEDLGLSLISISSSPQFDDKVFVVVLKEGYVVARVFAEKKYIAFDLLLWDDLGRVDAIKEGLISAVGGNLQDSTTSFRFVTGGMHGLESCQKDVLTQIALDTKESLCKNADDVSGKAATTLEGDSMATMLQVLISSLTSDKDDILIAVVCGDASTECSSVAAIKGMETSSKVNVSVIPVYACSSFDDMTACEKETQDRLEAAIADNKEMKKIDVLALDAGLPFAMGQIMEMMFRNKVTYGALLEESHIVVSPVPAGQGWRSVLLDRFRTDNAVFDPAHRADVRFYKPAGDRQQQQGDPYVEWCIFASGDRAFFNHLSLGTTTVRQKTGWTPQIQEVANGIISLIAELNVTKSFRDSDYDKTRATSQWRSQTPVGHQTIFQFTLQPPKTPLTVGERVLAEHEPGPWDVVYGGAVVRRVLGEGVDGYSVLYDGDTVPETIRRDQIRKYSTADEDMSLSFEVGDLIFYRNEDGLYQNGVVAQVERGGTAAAAADDDGNNKTTQQQHRFAINLLNTEGKKLYGVPRRDLMYQFESSTFVQDVPPLTIPDLMGALGYALDGASFVQGVTTAVSPMGTDPVGDGVIMTAFWTAGHAVLKWDGKARVDVNLFTYNGDGDDVSRRLKFQELFTGQLDHVNGVARDEHPRGYGRVVNFPSEIAHPARWVPKQ